MSEKTREEPRQQTKEPSPEEAHGEETTEVAEAVEENPEVAEAKIPEAEPAAEAQAAEASGEEPATEVPVPAAGETVTPADPQARVQAARTKVQSAEEEIDECLRNIQHDLEQFEAYEKENLLPVVEESQRLLEAIGMEEAPVKPALSKMELENPEEEKLQIEDLSSGKGRAFFWGLAAAVATGIGWYLYAVQKAGGSLIPDKIPDMGTLSALAGKISLLVGPAEHPPVGVAIVIGSALIVGWLVSMVLVAVRAARNRHIAEEVEEQAGFYCRKKEECKSMMEQVRQHLKTLRQTVEKYEVLLDEKNAGLRRAIFIEEAERFDKLHSRSQETARDIDALIKELDTLLATPMAQSGMLTPESVEALRHAKRVINDQILRLYS